MKRVIIYVNGILTKPGDLRDWNLRACIWTQINSDFKATPFEYFCDVFGRAFGQTRRAEKLADVIQAYKDFDITLVGHSNGCAVILAALNQMIVYPKINAVHLVSAACEADFVRNGLNEALESGKVGKVFVYRGGKDWALKLASGWLGRLLGYGVLGLHGAQNVTAMARNGLGELIWPDYGHGDCFLPEHFDRTMKHFTEMAELHD